MQRANKFQKRKRYNVKSKLPKIYAKRGLVKKSFISTSMTRARCEFVVYIRATSASAVVLNSSSNNFNNLSVEIPGSHTWSNLSGSYLRYKIYGLGIRVTPVADRQDISDGTSNVPICVAFYPTYQNISVPPGEILANDDAFRVEPFMTIPQTRYWNFPDGYHETGNGNGLGTWTSNSYISTQPGQLSFACHAPFQNFLDYKTLYMMRVMVYILFDGRRT